MLGIMPLRRGWLWLLVALALFATVQAGAEYVKHGEYHRLRYWDLLMQNPAGVQPTCTPNYRSCTSAEGCCSDNCEVNYFREQVCCVKQGGRCRTYTDCCTTVCQEDKTCGPAPCFSGDTKVKVQNKPGLVALRDVQTGDRIQCVNTTDDMSQPLALTYCEVVNWYHSQTVTFMQSRIHFTRPGGQKASLTLSPVHLMVKLTSALLGKTATSFDALGSFVPLRASDVRAGDRIAILKDLADDSQGFIVTAVDAVEVVEADGMFQPGIEYPYIVTDGVVAPVWIDNKDPVANIPSGEDGVMVGFKQYRRPTIYMVRMQQVGIAGKDSSWDGKPQWPGVALLNAAAKIHIDAGEAWDFGALRTWYKQRYAEWKANATAGVTFEEMMELVTSGRVWTKSSTRLPLPDEPYTSDD